MVDMVTLASGEEAIINTASAVVMVSFTDGSNPAEIYDSANTKIATLYVGDQISLPIDTGTYRLRNASGSYQYFRIARFFVV